LYFIKYEGGSQKFSSPIIQDTELIETSNAVDIRVYKTGAVVFMVMRFEAYMQRKHSCSN
jgi:hypothetical protein